MALIIHDPIYGEIQVTAPVLLELINSPAMQRLKGVDQHFDSIVRVPWEPYTRFDHCLGVMFLIKKFGGDLEEQIAGLLHDISHTAFSHAMDFVLGDKYVQNFHDQHVQEFLLKTTVPGLLKKYGFNAEKITDPKNFSLLEQEIPSLCADRVDYALKCFYSIHLADPKKLQQILGSLTNHENRIVFNDAKQAHDFAAMFLISDQQIWGGSALGNTAYVLFAKIVKKAYDAKLVTIDDFFKTDREFLESLDKDSKMEVQKLKNLKIQIVNPENGFDLHVNAKIRYVDPPVKINDREVKKLSNINPQFGKELTAALKRRKRGNYVRIL